MERCKILYYYPEDGFRNIKILHKGRWREYQKVTWSSRLRIRQVMRMMQNNGAKLTLIQGGWIVSIGAQR